MRPRASSFDKRSAMSSPAGKLGPHRVDAVEVESGEPSIEPSTRSTFHAGRSLAERRNDAAERLRAALAVDERARRLGERRHRQHARRRMPAAADLNGDSATTSSAAASAARAATGIRACRAPARRAATDTPCAARPRIADGVQVRLARQRAGDVAADRIRGIGRESRATRRSARRAPAPAHAAGPRADAAGADCRERCPCARRRRSSRAIAFARADGLEPGKRSPATVSPAAAAAADDDLAPAARGSVDGATIVSCATRISSSSSRAYGRARAAPPFRRTGRSRCASSGWSLRRKLPTTSTRSSAANSAIGMPSHGARLRALPSALKSDCAQAEVDVVAAQAAHELLREMHLLQRRMRRCERADRRRRRAVRGSRLSSRATCSSAVCQSVSRQRAVALRSSAASAGPRSSGPRRRSGPCRRASTR